jgi:hypothetical protein
MTTSFGTYSEDGYMFELPSFNKTKARDIIQFHRANRFFDVQTRAVFIDATLYNPSMERFVVMRLLAEVFIRYAYIHTHTHTCFNTQHKLSVYLALSFPCMLCVILPILFIRYSSGAVLTLNIIC